MPDSEFLATAVGSLVREIFHGHAAGSTWIVDGADTAGGNAGLLATLERLTPEQASGRSGGGRATVAGHAEHVRWFLSLLNAYARGERPEVDWNRSWTVHEVDHQAWARLRAELRAEAEAAASNMEAALRSPDLPEDRLMPILATMAHCAYHLGAVRQMVPPPQGAG